MDILIRWPGMGFRLIGVSGADVTRAADLAALLPPSALGEPWDTILALMDAGF